MRTFRRPDPAPRPRPGALRGPCLLALAVAVATFLDAARITYLLVGKGWTRVEVRIESLEIRHWNALSLGPGDRFALDARYAWSCGGEVRRGGAVGIDGDEVWTKDEAVRRRDEILARAPPYAWARVDDGSAAYLDPRFPTGTAVWLSLGLCILCGIFMVGSDDGIAPELAPGGLASDLGGLCLGADLTALAWFSIPGGDGAAIAMLVLVALHAVVLVAVAWESLMARLRAAPADVPVPLPRLPPRVRPLEVPPRLVHLEPLADPEAVRCPFCGDSMLGRTMVRCRSCQTLHHADCWAAGGLCTTYACGSAACDRVVVRTVGTTRVGD